MHERLYVYGWSVAGWVQDTALVLLDGHMVGPCEEDDRPVVTIVT